MADRRQRLWIITELFPPEETSTAYIMGEIADVLSTKYKVGVICGPEIYDKSRKISKVDFHQGNYQIYRAEVKTYNKNSIIGKGKSFLSTSLSLYHLAKKYIQRGDKVLMVTNPAPLIVLMSRLRKRRQFDLNILVHDVFPENISAAGLTLPFYSMIKSLFDKAYSNADSLIAIGRDMKDVLLQKTRGKVPIHIIENWGDFEGIKPIEMPEMNKIILEYAGNIGRVQGLEKIVTELPEDIELHFYGSGALEQFLKDKQKSNVYFHGPYSRNEQTEILGASNICLVTLNECMYGLGTPSKTYNILAAGRPILYFGPPNSEIALLISEHNIGYCAWPERWDIDELREKGRNAREIGAKLYTKEVVLNKFIDII